MRGIVLTVVLLLGAPFLMANAQISVTGIGGDTQIELSPAFPAPYSTFKATLNDYSTAAGGGTVNWRVNGVIQKDLENQRTVELTTSEAGKTYSVEAIVSQSSGGFFSAKKSITPIYLDLIVEPQTRVPHFYQARALPSVGSIVNVTALVNAGNTPKENLMYTWNVNGAVLHGGPIRGQNQVSVTMPQGGATLNVTVARTDGGVVAHKSIQLLTTEPLLKFYTVNALYGVSTRPINTGLSLVGNSTNVRAEPFFLDIRTFNNPDLLKWTIGGQAVAPTTNNPYELNLVRQGEGAPTTVGFHVRNLTEVLQGAESSFMVQ